MVDRITSLPTTTSATVTALVPLRAEHTQAARRPHHTSLVASTAAPLKVSTVTDRPRLLNSRAATVVSSNTEVLKANLAGLVSSTARASTALRPDTVASLNSTEATDSLREQVATAHKLVMEVLPTQAAKATTAGHRTTTTTSTTSTAVHHNSTLHLLVRVAMAARKAATAVMADTAALSSPGGRTLRK